MGWNPKKAYEKVHNKVSDFSEATNPLAQFTKKGTVAGELVRGNPAGMAEASKSHAKEKAEEKAAEMEDREGQQYNANLDYNKQLGAADDAYLASMEGSSSKYQSDLDSLRGEVEGAQKDARKVYSNDVQPRLKGLMESAQKNSAGAMTLQQAMDPNNKVAQSTRQLYADQAAAQQKAYGAQAAQNSKDYEDLARLQQTAYADEGTKLRDQYNQQGASIQKQYESQAQNEGRAGLADVGVLSALGMQNMAGQLGNVPMTGGQLQALMGANQAQSGAAYAQTQRRLQSLRDQGLTGNLNAQNQGLGLMADTRLAGLGRASDLQQSGLGRSADLRAVGLGRSAELQGRGLDQGFARSDLAYQQGLQAQDRYRNSVGDYENAYDRQAGRDSAFRGERGDLSNRSYGLQEAMANTRRGVGQGKTTRDMAVYNQHMGGQQANTAAQIAQINAGEQQRAQMIQGGAQAAGTAVGAYFGGPAGAAAGGQLGAQAGQAGTADMGKNAVPQYGNYGGGNYSQPSNYVEQGSQNPGYGARAGGTSYAGSSPGSMGAQQQGLGLTDAGFQANPYAYQDDRQRRRS